MSLRKPNQNLIHELAIADDHDYLDEDEIIPDQKFVVLSFYEPKDDVCTLREVFFMSEFIRECLREDPELGKQRVNFAKVSADKLIGLYHDFRYDNLEDLSKLAKEKYPTEMFERALKVRGSYKSMAKANDRKNHLKKFDALHSQYIAEVGKWLPFNPPESAIADYETSNKRLNEMLAAGRKNQTDAKEFYERERQERIRQEQDLIERRKQRIANNDENAIVAEYSEQEALGLQAPQFTKQAVVRKKQMPSKAAVVTQDVDPSQHGMGDRPDTSNYQSIRIKPQEFEHSTPTALAGSADETAYASANMAGDMKAINKAKSARPMLAVSDFEKAEFDDDLANSIVAGLKNGGGARPRNPPAGL
jgi:hypothetical protein